MTGFGCWVAGMFEVSTGLHGSLAPTFVCFYFKIIGKRAAKAEIMIVERA